MLGKGGLQRKWCEPAAMEPIVGASRTSDSVDYWHCTHSKSTCWKRSMTTTSFHSSKLLRMHTAKSAGTTWRNSIRITGKFIRKTMTKRKLFNYQSHPVLHAGIARTSRKRFVSCLVWGMWCAVSVTLQSAKCFTFDVLKRPILEFVLFFLFVFFFHHKHRTP